jgi:hypothetical protein
MKNEQERFWWIKKGASLDDMTREEWRELEAHGGGFLPARFQDQTIQVIKTEHLEAYEHARMDIWNRLINLDTNLKILESVDESLVLKDVDRCIVMTSRESRYVFRRMVWAVYGESVMLIATLLYDDDKNSLEIDRFRKSITTDWILPQFKGRFQEECKVFDKHTKRRNELGHKINRYRNTYYAHRNCDATKVKSVKLVGLPQLREAFGIASELFGCCTLWSGLHMYLSEDTETGIGEICDALVKDGLYVNQVKRLGGWVRMTAEQLRELNERRAKLGLTSVSPDELKDGIFGD